MPTTRSKAPAAKTASAAPKIGKPQVKVTKKSQIVVSAKPLPTDLDYHAFACQQDFESFMQERHKDPIGFYLKLAKKDSGIASIDWEQAVQTALCFGWIDGWGRGIDDSWRMIRFTPRRKQSLWSQKNVDTASRLIADGKMHPAGLAAIDAAKADGRWERAYSKPSEMTVPDDFQHAIDEVPAAAEFFASLNKTNRYMVLLKVQTATPKARPARIQALIETLESGRVPGVKATEAPRITNSSGRKRRA